MGMKGFFNKNMKNKLPINGENISNDINRLNKCHADVSKSKKDCCTRLRPLRGFLF
jgi:hypothetical protein